MKRKSILSVLRGGAATFLSIAALTGLGLGLATTWRSTVDTALGTSSYVIESEGETYKSTYKTGEEIMNALKNFAVKEGQEGTVIMKNDNNALPLTKNSTVALFGLSSYQPYMSSAGNSDAVDLEGALTEAGYTIDPTVKGIYDKIFSVTHTVEGWGGSREEPLHSPNTSAGDYTEYQIYEIDPARFETEFEAGENWENDVQASVGIVTFMRPGGEGTTYKPGSALDTEGNPTGKNPLALSDDELAVVDKTKETCDKVVVLLNTSCTIEVDPLVSGEHAVDAIAYVGIPNDYQFKGVVDVLGGEVNSTGRLADTYAASSTSSPGMQNFGGAYYTDYELVSDFNDTRWPGEEIGNQISGSFGGSATYSGGYYIVEAEGIYTGYNYYETRYYDSIMNPSFNANSAKGVTQGTATWQYNEEVNYTFGEGLSYIPYTQKITNVEVEDRVDGNITATIEVSNLSDDQDGLLTAQLYVQTPYTAYDRENFVEKSAIQFLNSKKVNVKAGEKETIEISIPTKYMASYDYTNAKTYIMDGGNYYFTAANGAHEAVNNVIKARDNTKDVDGDGTNVQIWANVNENQTDTRTYSHSETGEEITNVADNADLNYYLPDTVTYLSRSDWDKTYPVNYCEEDITLADSPKKDEWLKELRNQQYTVKTDDPLENIYGVVGTTFSATEIDETQINNINDPYWDRLVAAIPAEEAVGAVAHGGSRSDTLTNINNPIVVQNDGPMGFNRKPLSNNNLEDKENDPYWVDPETEAGQFRTNVNSQTLLGSSFNPDLAREWGRLLGNSGLWLREYQIWGGGLNYHRTPYNGRNTEYLSEDPMLTNVLGRELVAGCTEFGVICGPKHIGFNDQEHDRSGICVYMNEQKMRETDLRGFQGSVEEGKALGLMVAFNRVGAINASHHVGIFKNIVREEWGFKGLISTDMMNNKYYFNPEGCIKATITQMADFAGDNSHLNLGDNGNDATWTYLNPKVIENDQELVEDARQCLKYQLYAFANSAVLNIKTSYVMPWWEGTLIGVCTASAIIGGLTALGYVALTTFGLFKKEDK